MINKLTGDRLRKLVPSEELDYIFLKSILGAYKQPRSKISKWLADGTLIRIKKGLYVFGPTYAREPYSTETLANLIYGPSAISLEYALSFHGIIPERVEQITSITPKKNKQFSTPIGIFTYRYLHPEIYSIGITQYFLNETHPILIATPEKALADYFYCRVKDILFQTMEDMLSFLREDLRANNEIILTLDPLLLTAIQDKYKLKALEWIIKIVDKRIQYE